MIIAEIAASNIPLKCSSLFCDKDATLTVNIADKVKFCCVDHADLWRKMMLDNGVQITVDPAVEITIIAAEDPQD